MPDSEHDSIKPNNLDNLIINTIQALVQLTVIGLLFFLSICGFLIYENENKKVEERTERVAFCGVGSLRKVRSIHDTIKVEYANIDLGKTLFRNYCATCHNKNMKDDLTGPALGGVTERWKDYPNEDLFKFIRNSQEMIKSGHPRAVKLWTEWKPTFMNSFEDLTDEEIVAIIAYIEYW
ncbi:c-type cytochrome [Phaeodactylibacter xiamenensis]|uniref:c-type cytochrome n=1 Tax=Phaeodactylibacter xiamenensis TaxID=1524460 RepID=UPI003CCC0B99